MDTNRAISEHPAQCFSAASVDNVQGSQIFVHNCPSLLHRSVSVFVLLSQAYLHLCVAGPGAS